MRRLALTLAALLAALLALVGIAATAHADETDTDLAHACAALTAGVVDKVRDTVDLPTALVVLPDIAVAAAARTALGCSTPAADDPAVAAAHACTVLNRASLDRIADRLDASDQVRTLASDEAISDARGALGCDGPATAPGGDDALPVGGVDTGDGSLAA